MVCARKMAKDLQLREVWRMHRELPLEIPDSLRVCHRKHRDISQI